MILPEYVQKCPCCDGKGEYKQMYTAGCGGGYYRSMGPCDMCRDDHPGAGIWQGTGFVYKNSLKPVPRSVVEQIKAMNDTTTIAA